MNNNIKPPNIALWREIGAETAYSSPLQNQVHRRGRRDMIFLFGGERPPNKRPVFLILCALCELCGEETAVSLLDNSDNAW